MAWHARLSASQTKDWFTCPGTIALKELFPEHDPSGQAAQLGTCAHLLIEICLEKGVSPASFENRLLQIVHPDTPEEDTKMLAKHAKWPKGAGVVVFEVDEEMIDATTCFIDYVIGRLITLFPDQYDDTGMDEVPYHFSVEAVKRGQLKLEGRVNPLPERDDTGGTADVTIDAWPELMELVDYKNGTGVLVGVEGNLQLKSYTLGRAVENGQTIGGYEKYRYTIGQPRHHRAPPGGMSWEEQTPAQIEAFRKQLVAACKRVDAARECLANLQSNHDKAGQPSPTVQECRDELFQYGFLSVGEDGSHCNWCQHLNHCPAALGKVQETVGMDFEDDADEIDPALGANHIATILPWKPFIEKFLKVAAAKAEELAFKEEMPGYKIVRKGGNRAWKPKLDPKEVKARLVDHYGVDPAKIMNPAAEPTIRTGPQVEKVVPAKMREEFGKEFLHKPEGGLIMVPESDGREAYSAADAANDFDDVEE